jgi:hypothetical protein
MYILKFVSTLTDPKRDVWTDPVRSGDSSTCETCKTVKTLGDIGGGNV